MTYLELLQRVQREIPAARLHDFLRDSVSALRELASRAAWLGYRAEHRFVPVQAYENGTVVLNSADIGASDAAFTSAHVGATLRVVAEEVTSEPQYFEIVSVNSATTVTVDSVWPLDSQIGQVLLTVVQTNWPVWADFDRLIALRMEDVDRALVNPREYVFQWKAGVNRICFPGAPAAGQAYVAEYQRLPAAAESPASVVDVPVDLEDAFYQLVLWRQYGRLDQKVYGVLMKVAGDEYEREVKRVHRGKALAPGPQHRGNRKQF